MSGDEHRRALLAHVVESGRIALLAPFAGDLLRYALLVVGADALPRIARSEVLGQMLVRGHLGRVRTDVEVIDIALVPRDAAEAGIGELNREVAPPVAFGEVRVIALDAAGFTFGVIAIAPSTTGVLA